jgi:lipopolysaccharide export system permease protein
MSALSASMMLYIRDNTNATIMVSLGLLLSVMIYYINNFFYVLGNTEKISVTLSVWISIFILAIFNSIIIYKINEK